MDSNEIRSSFLDFFAEKNHKIIPSSSLIPHGDPTLLLTTAGMVQIKPYFLGQAIPPNPRLASCQKCFRTTDVDSVGDNKHLTFFEMLGNFSVGDYFKKEAITWAWEFVIERLQLPSEKLWVTIFLDDEQAFEIWKAIGFPEKKIVRLGEEDNFWGPAGDSGPCGPCSEIHYDFGDKYGCGKPSCGPDCGCGRFSEIWNLVFTEYNQDRQGKRTKLPKPNIDTGMGLERITAACSGNPTVYQTDLFAPLIQEISKISGRSSMDNEATDRAVKVIAEHSRGITFLIADGVLPSNEGRGYVLRRILRRACFLGRRLGVDRPFLSDLAEVVIKNMSSVYPELIANKKLVSDIITNEEEKFDITLDMGVSLCEKAIAEAKSQNRNCLLNEEVFKFWDTYGFPLELSAEIAQEHGLTVDRTGFEIEMEKQRERARSTHKFTAEFMTELGLNASVNAEQTEFVGYEDLATSSRILKILDGGKPIEKAGEYKNVTLILDKTPFYGEKGGQVGDTGVITGKTGKVEVINAQSLDSGSIAISGKIASGEISVGDTVEAVVNQERRLDIARNHTATHILQAVLRKVLGGHVAQRGSLVAPDRLRFDFTHLGNISKQQLNEIQSGVNKIIRQDLPVDTETCPYDQAINGGATAIFEEKYGEVVRVVKIGTPKISAELCGGTHIKATGEIGLFLVTSESSIGTGLRRIEAVTGRGAEELANERGEILEKLAADLRASPSELLARVAALSASLGASAKEIASLQRERSRNEIDILLQDKMDKDGVNIVSAQVSSRPMSALMEMGDMLKDRMKSGVIVLASVYEGKPSFIATATSDLIARGIHSGKLVKKVAEIAGGSGGGKAEMAQAGAKDEGKISQALQAVPKFVGELIQSKNG